MPAEAWSFENQPLNKLWFEIRKTSGEAGAGLEF